MCVAGTSSQMISWSSYQSVWWRQRPEKSAVRHLQQRQAARRLRVCQVQCLPMQPQWHCRHQYIAQQDFPKHNSQFHDAISLSADPVPAVLCLNDGHFCHLRPWRGSGLAIPVFSMRTKKSVGCGEFLDIKSMVKFVAACGMHVLQVCHLIFLSVWLYSADPVGIGLGHPVLSLRFLCASYVPSIPVH